MIEKNGHGPYGPIDERLLRAMEAKAMEAKAMEARTARMPDMAPTPPGLVTVLIERPDPGPQLSRLEPVNAVKVAPYFYAGMLSGMGGDDVLIEIHHHGVHTFSREDGRWLEGPDTHLSDCRIWGPDFHAKVHASAFQNAGAALAR